MILRSTALALGFGMLATLALGACDDAGSSTPAEDTAADVTTDEGGEPDADTAEPDVEDAAGEPDVAEDAGTDTEDVAAELPPVDDCAIEPTLSSLQAEYFTKSCGFGSCHSASGAKKSGNLSLAPGASFGELVGVTATKNPAKILVVPGDPDASFLIHKLEGPDLGEGELMPWGSQVPLDPDCRIKRVREWIAAGALDN